MGEGHTYLHGSLHKRHAGARAAGAAAVALPRAIAERKTLQAELKEATDSSDHARARDLELRIAELSETLTLYDAREQRRKLIKKLLAQSLVRQEKRDLQERIERYNEQLMDYDVPVIFLQSSCSARTQHISQLRQAIDAHAR